MVAVNKVEIRAVRDLIEKRMLGSFVDLVPPDMGDPHPGGLRLKPQYLTRDQAEPCDVTSLVPPVGKELHPQADAEQRDPVLPDRFPEGGNPSHAAKIAHTVREGADAGKHNASGGFQAFWIVRYQRGSTALLERAPD
jgi:hypothetical protein